MIQMIAGVLRRVVAPNPFDAALEEILREFKSLWESPLEAFERLWNAEIEAIAREEKLWQTT